MESFFYRYSFNFHTLNLVRKVRFVLDSCSFIYRRGCHAVRLPLQHSRMPELVYLGRYSVSSTSNLRHHFHCGGTIKVLQ